jgi:hypothetical protein
VIIKTAQDPEEYGFKLQQGLTQVPQGMQPKYMRNSDSCSGFSRETKDDHNEIYNLYVGPYADLVSACQARASLIGQDSPMAWVKPLMPQGNASARQLCSCTEPMGASGLPQLSHHDGQDAQDYDRRRLISDAQYVLLVHQLNPARLLAGFLTDATDQALRDYQAEQGIPLTGSLDTRTWQSMLNDYCKHPRYAAGGSAGSG